MDKDERNRIMDEIWAMQDGGVPGNAPSMQYGQRPEAIRRCDELARAWNALEVQLMHLGVPCRSADKPDELVRMTLQRVKHKMSELLNPTPKDPLEVLENWVHNHYYSGNPMFDKGTLLAEIRRLRGKK